MQAGMTKTHGWRDRRPRFTKAHACMPNRKWLPRVADAIMHRSGPYRHKKPVPLSLSRTPSMPAVSNNAPARLDASLGQALFAPRSVVIVGASDDPAKTSGRPLLFLRRAGFEGAVYP